MISMRSDTDWLAKRDALRASAESLLRGFGKRFSDKEPTEILLNELLIHKVELEVQVEELKRSSYLMEESRDRYLDLYDRSPIGLITINREGLMTELNLLAAKLLGVDRANFIHERFVDHIAAVDLEKWTHHFLSMTTDRSTGEQSVENAVTHSFSLRLRRLDASDFTVHIYCQRITTEDHLPALRLSLIDSADIIDAAKCM